MSEQPRRGSAKIYSFPSRPSDRAALRAGKKPTFAQEPVATPQVDFGAWYHDAAVRESEAPPRK